jgi:cytochrome c oxidase subunit III
MSEERKVLDVSGLPRVVFDHHNLLWWGTLGFVVIEGFTLVLMVASHFYLRINEYDWPPGRTPDPDLLIPTINVVVLLAIIFPMWMVEKAARRYDRPTVARWLLVAVAMSAVSTVLRWYELQALNARWDANAYASTAWGVVVLHSTLLLTDLFETGVFAILFNRGPVQKKLFPDVTEAAFYQYFLSTSWAVLYFIIYWAPRIL